jgi:hypothetical protein
MVAKRAPKSSFGKGENINIRIDPKLKYGLELLARRQHRTLTSVVEWAIGKALRDEKEGLSYRQWAICEAGYPDLDQPYTVFLLDKIWSPDPLIRFLNLVYHDEALLSYEEGVIWDIISNNFHYWSGKFDGTYYSWDPSLRGHLRLDQVRADWQVLNDIAAGQSNREDLSKWEPATALTSKGIRSVFATDKLNEM